MQAHGNLTHTRSLHVPAAVACSGGEGLRRDRVAVGVIGSALFIWILHCAWTGALTVSALSDATATFFQY